MCTRGSRRDHGMAVREPVLRVGRLALILVLAALAATRAIAAPGPKATHRYALVIGNGAYRDVPLKNPVYDARAMARVLERTGFEVVLLEDADLITMVRALRDFGDRITRRGIGLFYFA